MGLAVVRELAGDAAARWRLSSARVHRAGKALEK